MYEVSTEAITTEGDPQYHFYKVTGKQNIFVFNHRWLWHRISPNTDISQGHFYVRVNIIDMTSRVDKKTYTCRDCSVATHMKYEVNGTKKGRVKRAKTVVNNRTRRGHHRQLVNRNIWACDIIYVWGSLGILNDIFIFSQNEALVVYRFCVHDQSGNIISFHVLF